MYSEILGMLQQDYLNDYRSFRDLMGVMSPSPNQFGSSGLEVTSKPQLTSSSASAFPYPPQPQQQQQPRHPSVSRRNSNPPPSLAPTCRPPGLLDSVSVNLLSLQQQQQQHRRLDRSHSEPATERRPAGQQPTAAGQNSSRYKTELCRPFEESGQCKYGEKCQFAHGVHELRNLSRHPKYKTDLCRTFHTTGYCPYGSRCHFVHNTEERRRQQPVPCRGPLGSAGEPASPASLSGSTSPTSMLFTESVFSPSPAPSAFPVFQFPAGEPSVDLLLALPTSPSPVESLASDLETMSLSSGGSASGSPPTFSPLDQPRHLRLPVFSRMRKDDAPQL